MKKFSIGTSLSKTGLAITIRAAELNDAQAILNLSRAVAAEDSYQLVTLDELPITLASEQEWISEFSSRTDRIILIAEFQSEIIAMLDFCSGKNLRIAHTGEFGMSVKNGYRNQGIGSMLLNALIEWANANKKIEKINLSVHQTNESAITLYKKFGFETEGLRKKELKYNQANYVDVVLMSRFVVWKS